MAILKPDSPERTAEILRAMGLSVDHYLATHSALTDWSLEQSGPEAPLLTVELKIPLSIATAQRIINA
jgi:hypothetical protein